MTPIWVKKIRVFEREMTEKIFQARKRLHMFDYSLFILVFLALSFYRPDTLMIAGYFLLYSYLFFTGRKVGFYHLSISSILAIIWVIIARNEYGYNHEMYVILGLNSYPLFAWATGLFVAYLIYAYWEKRLEYTGFGNRLILFISIYWPLLIFVETVAYHYFHIQNLSTAMYSGLPLCDCLHAPKWMQTVYFMMGPIYFTICQAIGLENPHTLRKKKTLNNSQR